MNAEVYQSAISDIAAELTLAVPLSMFADNGMVQLGGQAPLFRLEMIADIGSVRIGGQSPMF